MQPQYTREVIQQKNAMEWDQFLIDNACKNPFQCSKLLLALENNKTYQPVGCFFRENTTREIMAGYVLYKICESQGITSFFTKRSIINGGPVFADNDEQLLSVVFENIIQDPENDSVYIDLWHDNDSNAYKNVLEKLGFKYSPHLNFFINLKESKDKIWGNISKRKRRYIKLLTNDLNFNIRTAETLDDIKTCYQLFQKTYQRIRLPLIDLSVFEDAFISNCALFLIAEYEKTPIACRAELLFGEGVYDWYAGDDPNYRSIHSNEAVIWNVLEYGMENGYSLFNFGGAGAPNKPYGPRDFKSEFSNNLVEYGRHRKVISPLRNSCINIMIKLREFVIRQGLHCC